jgi:cyclase
MGKPRVIPILLLSGRGLVKTEKFKRETYVGDPINAVKIFNEKEVDELVVLDLKACKENREPDIGYIQEFASECFIPLCYGGGVKNIEIMKKIYRAGVEKISLNSVMLDRPELLREAASIFGSQSIVVSIDVKKDLFGKFKVYSHKYKKLLNKEPEIFAQELEQLGAGEVLLNSVDRDGTASGMDVELIKRVSSAVSLPVIACGGAASLEDFKAANIAGASAVGAGRLFVFHGRHKAVLISYPSQEELNRIAV